LPYAGFFLPISLPEARSPDITATLTAYRTIFAVDRAPRGLHTFNLGCHDSLSVTRIAQMVADAMGLAGVRYEYTGGEGGWPGDVPRFRLDVTAINRLGWRAHCNSEEAVALAIKASQVRGTKLVAGGWWVAARRLVRL
jgi:nucleoside-diphosphate-sugar epimerase